MQGAANKAAWINALEAAEKNSAAPSHSCYKIRKVNVKIFWLDFRARNQIPLGGQMGKVKLRNRIRTSPSTYRDTTKTVMVDALVDVQDQLAEQRKGRLVGWIAGIAQSWGHGGRVAKLRKVEGWRQSRFV
jgi:dissimilatory sulfite reductase (desulfoviridin) alpha/beta subunit